MNTSLRCAQCGSSDITCLGRMESSTGDISVYACDGCGFEWDTEIRDEDE